LALSDLEEIRFKSFDDTQIQGWLMKPVGWRDDQHYPLILSIHGGPHGMYGYAFNATFQAYAARGYAVLFINPRGSTGYGQKFSDGTLNECGAGRRCATSNRSRRRPSLFTASRTTTCTSRKPKRCTWRSGGAASRLCSCATRAKATACANHAIVKTHSNARSLGSINF